MPHRNMKDQHNLRLSLDKLTNGKPKHVIITGDFNCPDIDWVQEWHSLRKLFIKHLILITIILKLVQIKAPECMSPNLGGPNFYMS
jgi:hypothetical protein